MIFADAPTRHPRAICVDLRKWTGHSWNEGRGNSGLGTSFQCVAPTSVTETERKNGAAYVIGLLRSKGINPAISHDYASNQTQILISKKQALGFLNSQTQTVAEAAVAEAHAADALEVTDSEAPLSPDDLKQMRTALELLVDKKIASWSYNDEHRQFVVSLPADKARNVSEDLNLLQIRHTKTLGTENNVLIQIDAEPWNAMMLAQELKKPTNSVYVSEVQLEGTPVVSHANSRS